jgi:arsenite methyltransferase
MSTHDQDFLRVQVRSAYGEVAERGGGGCGVGCCAPVAIDSTRLGYSTAELALLPEGADLGLGCGNPQAIADLKAGETVLDLGAGAGVDALLAARQVGAGGRVIGVDMTPEMLSRARTSARNAGVVNVEFRLGEIEALPVADGTVDVIISNCVINLSPDKGRVFREACRVLRPGGRLAISDVVATAELPPAVRGDLDLYSGCVAGAAGVDELTGLLQAAGFERIRIAPKDESREFIRDWAPGSRVEDYVCSASIQAVKPALPVGEDVARAGNLR